MIVRRNNKIRATILSSFCGTAMLLTACGSDSSDPKIVDVDELQAPRALSIADLGDGKVRLSWAGSNNEDDFDGYNIYGAKWSTALESAFSAANLKEGSTLQLLTNEGEPDGRAKSVLQQMAFNGTDLNTPGTSTDPEKEFEFYPIYSDDKKLTPTCQPKEATGSSECVLTAKESPDPSVLNGSTYFEWDGLEVGSKYCFLILSSMDAGEKVSQSTSEVRCIIPRKNLKTNPATLTLAANQSLTIDLAELRSCTIGSDCEITPTISSVDCDGDTEQALCVETFGSSVINFTTGKNTVMQDLGTYSGFADPSLPALPKITSLDPDKVKNGSGFSIPGQSLPILGKHTYLVAEAANDAATSFFYHYIYVSNVNYALGSVAFEARLSVAADQ